MRLLTFSFLKSSRLKAVRLARQLSAPATSTAPQTKPAAGDPSLVEVAASWPVDEEPELRRSVLQDMQVLPDFVSEAEEAALLDELEPVFKRLRYEFDHWDNAIQGYRETERRTWRSDNEAVMTRIRARAFAPGARLLPATHVLDLAAAGFIKPHVDAVRFCGPVIAGLCLCSGAVMRLQHAQRAHLQLDALLQRRALYIMKGVARYDFSHAVLGGEHSAWRGAAVQRRRRVALIARTEPRPEDVSGKMDTFKSLRRLFAAEERKEEESSTPPSSQP